MKNLETTEGAVSVVGRSCELVWAVPENDEIDDDFAEKVELEGEGGKTEDRLEIEEEFAIWFADVPDRCEIVVSGPVVLLATTGEASFEFEDNEDLLVSDRTGVDGCGGVPVERLPRKERNPPDFFSTAAAFEVCSSAIGSIVLHPGGMSSLEVTTVFLIESSQAARFLAKKRCDIGLLRTIGRFLVNFKLFVIDFAMLEPENESGG